MSLRDDSHQHVSLRGIIYRPILVGLAISLIIGCIIITLVPSESQLGSVTPTSEISGPFGPAMHNQSSPATNRFVLLNTTNFTSGSGWRSHVTTNDLTDIRLAQQQDGLSVEGANGGFWLHYYLNIPVEMYTALNISLLVDSNYGDYVTGVTAEFETLWSNLLDFRNSTDIRQVGPHLTSLAVPIDTVRNKTHSWAVQVRIKLWFTLGAPASFVIKQLLVTAASATPLLPFTFDFKDHSGNSIYTSIESRYMTRHPILNLTDNHHTESVIFIQWSPHEALYLPAGNYSVIYGWILVYQSDGLHIEFSKRGDFSFVVADKGISIDIVLRAVCLELDINRGLLFGLYLMNDDDSSFIFFYILQNYIPTGTPRLYIPEDSGLLELDIFLNTPQSRSLAVQLNITGSHDLLVHSRFPYHPIIGIHLDTVQLFLAALFIGLLIASFVSLRRATVPISWENWYRRDFFVPTVLLLLGYLLPWVSRSTVVAGTAGISTITQIDFIPAGFEVQSISPGESIMYLIGLQKEHFSSLIDYWDIAGLLPIIVILFWLPLLNALYHLINGSPLKRSTSIYLTFGVPGLIAALSPIFFMGHAVLIGILPVLASCAYVVLKILMQTKKWMIAPKKSV